MQKGKCERCGAKIEPGEADYCAICSKDLCTECMVKGCCGNVPALSGMGEEYGDDKIEDEEE
jgi:hypothetical protein